MYKKLIALLPVLLALLPAICIAQPDQKKIEEYLHTASFPVAKDASAIVLYEHEEVSILIEDQEIKQTRKGRTIIKILKKNGLDAADVKLHFFAEKYWESLKKITGTTYNLAGNEVKKTNLPKNDFYKNKLIEDYQEVSFTMPDAREGGIIDYTYEIDETGDDFSQEWEIQDDYPKLFTEFSFTYPAILSFTSLLHTKPQLQSYNSESKAESSTDDFCQCIKNTGAVEGSNSSLYIRRNVPAINKEPFVINSNDHNERIQLQLAKIRRPGLESYLQSWQKVNERFWGSEVAKAIRKDNNFLSETVKTITATCADNTAKAKAIFNYVRSNYRVNEESKIERGNIAEVFRTKEGRAANINALLAAMLNNAGLQAYLIFISTTDQTSVTPTMPFRNSFNYTVCAWAPGATGTYVYLDATNKNNPFGMLPMVCYNGYARVMTKEGEGVYLKPEMLEDRNNNAVKITFPNDSTETVEIVQRLGLISSKAMREEMAKDGFSKAQFGEQYVARINDDITITETKFDNVDKPDTNLIIKIVYRTHFDAKAASYLLSTAFIKTFGSNPFTGAGRTYPIEFPYKTNTVYRISYLLPQGLEVENLPKPRVINLGDNDMQYKKDLGYMSEMNMLSISGSYNCNEVKYPVSSCDNLKAFYEEVIKEENNVITLKRK